MDMDMDIPLPEELELLESNARLLEDYPDLELPEPYPYEDQEAPSAAQPPPSPDLQFDSEIQVFGQKRSRSVSPNGSLSEAAELSEEKRCRTDESERATDEDWLRYSPPKGSESVVAEQASFVREKMLSRYASEIDGECIPITAPNGDRVYARLDRLEGEERLKKLDVRANTDEMGLESSHEISEVKALYDKCYAFSKTPKVIRPATPWFYKHLLYVKNRNR